MKKLLFLLVLIAGIAAVVTIVRKRSEGSFEDSWDTSAQLPNRLRDMGKSAA
jgi:UTP-glucose-1-phosphate uridylyltransferase